MSAKLPAALLAALGLAACAHAEAPAPLVPEANRAAWVAACTDWDDWDKPAPPYRIYGNTYHVGTCGIAAILIVGDEGAVLIDSGTAPGSDVIAANIAALGFAMADVKALFGSHEHFDHVGGMARLQQASGAPLWVGADAVPVMRTGKDDPRDPQAGMHDPMEPVTGTVRAAADGEVITAGGTAITAIATPGHTLGAMSWQWQSCDEGACITIVYADSLSPVSADVYRFTDHPEYVAMFRRGIARLDPIACDLLLTPHPSASAMRARLAGDAPWIDPGACQAYAAMATMRLDNRLAKEATAQ
ncbi:subclass B3 metallo-beta-lactamase [Porphyrobacter sp. AAP60]|uniref:subclass B3 metallo-beta-lactamase n=1 Tax=Porphyrobacter sp. AAP60 TaxID=1523423 RepID=UPI0009E807D6|nr:subclass B3 metallo-beta-lactamase [Porphyrobacter sp. AAP60]